MSSCSLPPSEHSTSSPQSEYLAVAFYHFVEIADPESEVKVQKEFLSALDAKARSGIL